MARRLRQHSPGALTLAGNADGFNPQRTVLEVYLDSPATASEFGDQPYYPMPARQVMLSLTADLHR